jgi:DNA-3-methyladenine glycosylase II
MTTDHLHHRFVATAATLSPALARDLAACGPVSHPERADHGPGAFLARAVVGQQISAAAARGIWGRIEDRARAEGASVADFLARAGEADLRACGLSRNKAKAVLHIHAAEAAQAIAALGALDHAGRCERLRAIWGIGPWTCDMMAIFYYREPDIWPAGDLAVQRVFRSYLGRRRPAKAAALFAPNRSLLALYMWRLAGGLK